MADPNKFVVLLIFAVIGIVSTCPNGWTKHDDMCYHFSHDSEDFPGARAMCKLIGGQLVEIENATEGEYLSNQVQGSGVSRWFALTDISEEGTWIWSNSHDPLTLTNYKHWMKGEPNNHHHNQNCAYIEGTHGMWYDGTCSSPMHYICEKAEIPVSVIG